MQRVWRVLIATVAMSLVASSASARIIWRGDFETGDLSQWTKSQMVNSNRLRIVSDPVRQGRHALRTEVRVGDDPIRASGHRNELVYSADNPVNQTRVYSWSTLWPSAYVSPDTWQLFTQFHHTGLNGSPPVEMYTRGEEIQLRVGGSNGRIVWRGPLLRGRWQDFVLHIHWSANEGWVELYRNGERVLGRTSGQTAYPGQGIYLKQGLYRSTTVRHTQVLFHDAMVVATELSDVLPPPPLAQPVPSEGTADREDPLAPEGDPVPSETPGEVAEDPNGGVIVFPNGEVLSVRGGGCSTARAGLLSGVALAGLLAAGWRRRRS